MKRSALVVAVVTCLLGCTWTGSAQTQLPKGDGWIALFDGQSLDGWKPAQENEATFQARDGQIVVNGDPEKKYGRSHLFYAGPVGNANFKNFEFKADVLTKPNANSGIYFHTKYQEKGWPSAGYESQVNQSYIPDPKKSGGLYNVVNISKEENPAKDNEWYTHHIIVVGKRVVVRLITGIETDNPKIHVVVDYNEAADDRTRGPKLSRGTFALQAHDPGSEIHYRNIHVKPLPDTLGEDQGWTALFDGRTLEGWEQINGTAEYEVKDGTILGTTAQGSPNSFLCTKKHYSDFALTYETKLFDPSLNSGVQIRSNSLEDYRNGRVHGYQVETSTNGNAGFIYDEARRGWLTKDRDDPRARAAFEKDDWNEYYVVCYGDTFLTWVNDVFVTYLVDSMTDKGFIGLQVHSFRGDEPAQVAWRDIRLKEL